MLGSPVCIAEKSAWVRETFKLVGKFFYPKGCLFYECSKCMPDYTQGSCQYVFVLGNERKCVLIWVVIHNSNIFCFLCTIKAVCICVCSDQNIVIQAHVHVIIKKVLLREHLFPDGRTQCQIMLLHQDAFLPGAWHKSNNTLQ